MRYTVLLSDFSIIATGDGAENFPRWDHPYWSTGPARDARPRGAVTLAAFGDDERRAVTLAAFSDDDAIARARAWAAEFATPNESAPRPEREGST